MTTILSTVHHQSSPHCQALCFPSFFHLFFYYLLFLSFIFRIDCMSSDDINHLDNNLCKLHIAQSQELVAVLVKHQQDQDALLLTNLTPLSLQAPPAARTSNSSQAASLKSHSPTAIHHWSNSKQKLAIGSPVTICTTAKVGK